MKYQEISVVVPCYKESAVIESTLMTLSSYLENTFERFEIVVVIDGSPDDTAKKVQTFGEKHSHIPITLISFNKNQGKGAAVKEGVLASRYEFILFTDADLAVPIEEVEHFIFALSSSDMAIASRLLPETIFEDPAPWYRTLLARGFYILQILILGNIQHPDTQCGFKLFHKNQARVLFKGIRIKRFAFDAELLFLAKKLKLSVATLPVTIKKDTRNTNVRVLADSFNMFFALILIRFNSWLGRYDDLSKA